MSLWERLQPRFSMVVSTRALERGGAVAAVGLWALSLALPAVAIVGGPVLRGSDVLLRGWETLDAGVYAWLANPLFLVAAVLSFTDARRIAASVGSLALVFAATSFGAAAVLERPGMTVPDFTFASGFYVWLTGYVVLPLSRAPRLFLVDPPRAPP